MDPSLNSPGLSPNTQTNLNGEIVQHPNLNNPEANNSKAIQKIMPGEYLQ